MTLQVSQHSRDIWLITVSTWGRCVSCSRPKVKLIYWRSEKEPTQDEIKMYISCHGIKDKK